MNEAIHLSQPSRLYLPMELSSILLDLQAAVDLDEVLFCEYSICFFSAC